MVRETGVVLPIVALTPLTIIPFSKVVEGEKPTYRSLIGGIIAVLGVILLTMAGNPGLLHKLGIGK